MSYNNIWFVWDLRAFCNYSLSDDYTAKHWKITTINCRFETGEGLSMSQKFESHGCSISPLTPAINSIRFQQWNQPDETQIASEIFGVGPARTTIKIHINLMV